MLNDEHSEEEEESDDDEQNLTLNILSKRREREIKRTQVVEITKR